MFKLKRLCLLGIAFFGGLSSAAAGDRDVKVRGLSPSTLQAITRTLNFLESGPSYGNYNIAIIYNPSILESETIARSVGARLDGHRGPKRTTLQSKTYGQDELPGASDPIHVVLFTPGTDLNLDTLTSFVRTKGLVSISTDRACLDVKNCVLMINADRKVEIVLDTQLANEVGAEFSSVFQMMVTRR